MQDDVVVMVLAGGAGERLYPLTKERAKPAVYFGGPYRIIDFTLSNCINSGLRKIFIALQYKSLSLSRHIRMGWSVVADELGEFIEILSPQKRVGEHWYLGTADAVYQNLYSILREDPRHLIVLSGDHVYKMDYARMLRGPSRARRRARPSASSRFRRKKPAGSACCRSTTTTGWWASWRSRRTSPPGGQVLASMGIYIFDMKHLVPALEADARRSTTHDFGKDILPELVSKAPVYAYRFTDENKKDSKYWRDIGTLDAYYDANMDLCRVNPDFNLYDPEWPLRTHQVQAPPAKFVFADEGERCGQALDSIISAGCIISGSRIAGSVLCPNVRVHSFCTVEQSILMPGVRVGRHARIRRAIIDRDVFIPRGGADRLQRRGRSTAPHGHRKRYRRGHHRRRAVHRRDRRTGAAQRAGIRSERFGRVSSTRTRRD